MKNGRAGSAHEFSKKLDHGTKDYFFKVLRTVGSDPKTLTSFIERFLNYIKNKNLLIRFKDQSSYALVIFPDEIWLTKNYKEIIIRGTRWPDNKITFQHYTDEGLGVIKRLFSEMLENKKEELISNY